MNKETLRQAANNAKERLKSGYWREAREAGCARISGKPDTVFLTRAREDDPVFRAKVRYILESEEQILNPIRLLVDRETFEKSDLAARQKIIFETSERFHRVKAELEREKEGQPR